MFWTLFTLIYILAGIAVISTVLALDKPEKHDKVSILSFVLLWPVVLLGAIASLLTHIIYTCVYGLSGRLRKKGVGNDG